jgi:hypothetical protein
MVHNVHHCLSAALLHQTWLIQQVGYCLHFHRDVMSVHHQKGGGSVISVLIFASLVLLNKTLNIKCYQPH